MKENWYMIKDQNGRTGAIAGIQWRRGKFGKQLWRRKAVTNGDGWATVGEDGDLPSPMAAKAVKVGAAKASGVSKKIHGCTMKAATGSGKHGMAAKGITSTRHGTPSKSDQRVKAIEIVCQMLTARP